MTLLSVLFLDSSLCAVDFRMSEAWNYLGGFVVFLSNISHRCNSNVYARYITVKCLFVIFKPALFWRFGWFRNIGTLIIISTDLSFCGKKGSNVIWSRIYTHTQKERQSCLESALISDIFMLKWNYTALNVDENMSRIRIFLKLECSLFLRGVRLNVTISNRF